MAFQNLYKWWHMRLRTHFVTLHHSEAVATYRSHCELGITKREDGRFVCYPAHWNTLKGRTFGGVACPPVFFIES